MKVLIIQQILAEYKLPVGFIMGMVSIIVFSKYVIPHIGGLGKIFTASKDIQIRDLSERLRKLEDNYDDLMKDFNRTRTRENQLVGLLKGLSHQLKEIGVDIDEELDHIQSI